MCAFLLYAMWWHKPLSPNEPFVLKADWVRPLCAYMYMSSEVSGEVDMRTIKSQTIVKTLFAFLRLYSKVPELETMSYQPHVNTNDADLGRRPRQNLAETDCESASGRASGEANAGNDGLAHDAEESPMPSQCGLEPSSIACRAELRSKTLDKAAGTAFFERRPRVKGTESNSNIISQNQHESMAARQ